MPKDQENSRIELPDLRDLSPVDSRLELLDPNPNIHHLFSSFDDEYFWGMLKGVEVKWSPRMTLCAGICRYETRSGYCTIGLSKPLLSLRPRKDLVETLLHEMIHAYLFVTHNNRDRDGHGPQFLKHMHRINNKTGASISVYHSFHSEVRAQKVHVWRCEGPCKDRPPFWGYVRRSMNRAPGPSDTWHREHKFSCGGTFVKILEPEGFKSRKPKRKKHPEITKMLSKTPNTVPSPFKSFSGKGHVLGSKSSGYTNKPPNSSQNSRDITSFYPRHQNNISVSSIDRLDSDLLVTKPPPAKKQKTDDTLLECPICKKTGFNDLNAHANYCLEMFELSDTPLEDVPSTSTGVPSVSPVTNVSQVCTICSKIIPGNMDDHIQICIASIPCDSDEEDAWEVDVANISQDVISSGVLHTSQDATSPDPTDVEIFPWELDNDCDDDDLLIVSEKGTTAPPAGKSDIPIIDILDDSMDTVICPICDGEFKSTLINRHLDTCLSQ